MIYSEPKSCKSQDILDEVQGLMGTLLVTNVDIIQILMVNTEGSLVGHKQFFSGT